MLIISSYQMFSPLCLCLCVNRCVVPDIVVETPLLNFQRCFLDYPYEQNVCLTNPGTVPTCYGVLDKV